MSLEITETMGSARHPRPRVESNFSARYDVPGLNAYCTSDRCCRMGAIKNSQGKTTYKRKTRAVKAVPRGTKDCDDCGSVLLWRRVDGPKE